MGDASYDSSNSEEHDLQDNNLTVTTNSSSLRLFVPWFSRPDFSLYVIVCVFCQIMTMPNQHFQRFDFFVVLFPLLWWGKTRTQIRPLVTNQPNIVSNHLQEAAETLLQVQRHPVT